MIARRRHKKARAFQGRRLSVAATTKEGGQRISGGRLKGRSFRFISDQHIRPSMDRIRQAVFNMIGPSIEGASFLDLFAGTGALGLEAISRGAGELVFVDQSARSIQLMESNLEKLKISYRRELFDTARWGDAPVLARVVRASAKQYLAAPHARGFEFIYMDPPYHDSVEPYLQMICHYGNLAHNGRIIVEHRQEIPPMETYVLVKKKFYGDKCLSILELNVYDHKLVKRSLYKGESAFRPNAKRETLYR